MQHFELWRTITQRVLCELTRPTILCLYAFNVLEHVTASVTGGPSGPLFRDMLLAGWLPFAVSTRA